MKKVIILSILFSLTFVLACDTTAFAGAGNYASITIVNTSTNSAQKIKAEAKAMIVEESTLKTSDCIIINKNPIIYGNTNSETIIFHWGGDPFQTVIVELKFSYWDSKYEAWLSLPRNTTIYTLSTGDDPVLGLNNTP